MTIMFIEKWLQDVMFMYLGADFGSVIVSATGRAPESGRAGGQDCGWQS